MTPGTGKTVLADELTDGTLGTGVAQYIKIMDGTLDSSNKATVTAGGALKVDLSATGANSNKILTTPDLPTGASTSAAQTTGNNSLASIDGKITTCNTGAVTVSSSALPSGAATSAKQPALGTAGAASSDVISVQGIASMTPLSSNLFVGGSVVTTSNAVPVQPPASGALPVSQSTATNLKAQAECYQGGSAVAAGNPLQVTLANGSVPSHAVTNAGTFAVQAAGDVASGSSDSGSPVKAGAVAHTAAPTAVTDGQRVNLIADKVGKLVTVGSIRDLKGQQQTTITSSTSETTVVTAVASTFLDVYGVIVTNTSATATSVTFKDSTAGTTRFVLEVPATDTRGFMLPESAAITQASVNNNWTATCGTSVASVYVTVLYVKNI